MTPQVTAKWTVDGRECSARVINPGGWFGQLWYATVAVSNTGGPEFAIEAPDIAEAIDALADSEYAHLIAIDVESDGDDYGEPLASGKWRTLKDNTVSGGAIAEPYYAGNAGIPCDLANLAITRVTSPVRYHAAGFPPDGIPPAYYDRWEWQGDRFTEVG